MKDKTWLWLLLVVPFLGLIGGLVPSSAYAGDDPSFQLAMSVDGGFAVACSDKLTLGHKAVQPTVNAYVYTNPNNDGGVSVTATSAVLVGASKMYDIWTTSDRPFICCKPAIEGVLNLGTDGGYTSTCKGFTYREF